MKTRAISLTIKPELCTDCKACELACSFKKEGIYSPALSRIHVIQIYEYGVNVPIVCSNCDQAPCIDSCPSGAIGRLEEGGVVVIDEGLCSACGDCVEVCPYGAVHMPLELEVALMCDLCGGEPFCVESCLYGALKFDGKADQLFSAINVEGLEGQDEARRWSLAETIAHDVSESWKVEA
ncbi:MAG: 4Fe-4S dicluster domain-containing protein [Anaerolineales bacterium]|nr:4Fe-4S dicluster domain-containing protein [Anaerolineales bacterium]